MEMFLNFLIPFLDIKLLLLVALGTFLGIYVGAIPGLSVTMATVILLTLTYTWETNGALALIVGIYVGGVYGGSRSAILLNIPGAPAAIATTFDGFPLAQRGEAGLAIGLSTIMSVIGGMIGVIFLAFSTPYVSKIALDFSHRDYFMLALMGLLLIGSLSKGSFIKSLFVAFLGINLGLIGLDHITGVPRFTYDSLQLSQGINLIVAILGIFGFSEVLYQLSKTEKFTIIKQVGRIIPTWKQFVKYLPLSLRTSTLGVIIGALPGVGGEIAALISYDHAKRTTKNPSRPFGEGAYEGVIAPESANNAAVGGAFIPMLTLGIPGDAVTAVIIGALVTHGLTPGPMLMINTPDLFWIITGSLFLANIFLLIFGLTGIGVFKKIATIPKGILFPCITLLTIIGAYSINNSIIDIYWMIAFGFIGLLLKTFNFPVAPLILGIVLGPLIDRSFRGAMMASYNDLPTFLLGFVTSPISLILTLSIIFTLVSNTNPYKKLTQAISTKIFKRSL